MHNIIYYICFLVVRFLVRIFRDCIYIIIFHFNKCINIFSTNFFIWINYKSQGIY